MVSNQAAFSATWAADKFRMFVSTICKPTRVKQEVARRLAAGCDAVVLAGTRTSANTKRLYEVARSVNAETHWVESADEVEASWFEGMEEVGVAAGASTPDAVTQAVVARIENIGRGPAGTNPRS